MMMVFSKKWKYLWLLWSLNIVTCFFNPYYLHGFYGKSVELFQSFDESNKRSCKSVPIKSISQNKDVKIGKSSTESTKANPSGFLQADELRGIFAKNKALLGVMKSTANSQKPLTSPQSIKKVVKSIPNQDYDSIKKILDYNRLLMSSPLNNEIPNKQVIRQSLNMDKRLEKGVNEVKQKVVIPKDLTEEEEISRVYLRNKLLLEFLTQEVEKINEAFSNKRKITSTLNDWVHSLKYNHRNSWKHHRRSFSIQPFQYHAVPYSREAMLQFLEKFEEKNPTLCLDLSKEDEIIYCGALDEKSSFRKDRLYLLTIDLHGLTLTPAVQIVRSSIHYYTEKYRNPNVDFIIIKYIVGLGKHSGESGPVLGPSIGRLLKQDSQVDVVRNSGEIIVRIEN